jgi:predicted nuclease of predicted toxin-antitoxin system
MRFIVDECTGSRVAAWLRSLGHDVFSVYDEARGVSDDAVLARSLEESRILVTNDKDFGDKIYRDQHSHVGIVL